MLCRECPPRKFLFYAIFQWHFQSSNMPLNETGKQKVAQLPVSNSQVLLLPVNCGIHIRYKIAQHQICFMTLQCVSEGFCIVWIWTWQGCLAMKIKLSSELLVSRQQRQISQPRRHGILQRKKMGTTPWFFGTTRNPYSKNQVVVLQSMWNGEISKRNGGLDPLLIIFGHQRLFQMCLIYETVFLQQCFL